MSHPDLTRGHALLCTRDDDAAEQDRALARILARLGAGQDTAAQARHVAEALGLIEPVPGRIWDENRQAFVPLGPRRRRHKRFMEAGS